jgi:hypothetical protein
MRLDGVQLVLAERQEKRVPAPRDQRWWGRAARTGASVEEIAALGDELRRPSKLPYSTQQRCSREYRSRSAQCVLQPSSPQRVLQTSTS